MIVTLIPVLGPLDGNVFSGRSVPKPKDQRRQFQKFKRLKNSLDVRFESKADIRGRLGNVRFTPKSRHWNSVVECPLCAKSGHAKGLPARFGAKPSFNGIPLPALGQRVTWIFIQGVAMCQTLLTPSPVTSPALVSLDQV